MLRTIDNRTIFKIERLAEKLLPGVFKKRSELSDKVLSNISKKFVLNNKELILFFDTTILYTGKTGLAICKDGLYFKEIFSEEVYIGWYTLKQTHLLVEGDSNICFKHKNFIYKFNAFELKYHLLNFLQEIQEILIGDQNKIIPKVLVLGRTGVGKSSFINYFLGSEMANSGVGQPMTQEMFTSYEYRNSDNFEIQIVDTKGIEVKDAHEYVPKLTSNIIEKCTSKNPNDWYHTIFYCTSINNRRFEDFEIKLINDLSKNTNQNIHIILTHFTENSSSNADEIEKYIRSKLENNHYTKFYRVCSVSKNTRGGKKIEPYGREIIIDNVFKSFIEDIAKKISYEYIQEHYYIYKNISNNLKQDLYKAIKNDLCTDSFFKQLNKENKTTILLDTLYQKDFIISYVFDSFKIEMKFLNGKFNKKFKEVEKIYNSYQTLIGNNRKDICLNHLFDNIFPFYDFQDIFYEQLTKAISNKLNISHSELMLEINNKMYESYGYSYIYKLLVDFNRNKKDRMICLDRTFEQINKIYSKDMLQKRLYDMVYNELFSRTKETNKSST